MKINRIIPLLLISISFLSACSTNGEGESKVDDKSIIEKSNVEKVDNKEKVDYKSSEYVEITLPIGYHDDEGVQDVIDVLKVQGIDEIIKNEDGSITYFHSKPEHEKMLNGMKDDIDSKINELILNENFSTFKDFKYDDSLSNFYFTLTAEDFEKSQGTMEMFIQIISHPSMTYQLHNGVADKKVNFHFIDYDTGENYGPIVFPDDFNMY